MAGTKTNERPGVRASLSNYGMSASKARVVLNLVRGVDVQTARDILSLTTREAAGVINKVLASAVANAVNNSGYSADELYVAAAYADEGPTMKRFSPRARGRAGRINKRSCHITVIVARMDDDRLAILNAARSAQAVASRSRRVAGSRTKKNEATDTTSVVEEAVVEGPQTEVVATDVVETNEVVEVATEQEVVSVDTDEETDK
ncbi:MAG: 50S ribosomal protein L22 [Actinobacteria bacterium]|nr:50S ribosomal protein L22 [Actinomycetota bacterium]